MNTSGDLIKIPAAVPLNSPAFGAIDILRCLIICLTVSASVGLLGENVILYGKDLKLTP